MIAGALGRVAVMEVLVVGAGAAAGYLGAQLVTAGRDVSFLVHQSSFERLTAHGLRIHGKSGTSALAVRVVTASQLEGRYDVVVLAVRSEVVESAVEDFRGVVTPDTRVLPLVNGMAQLSVLTAAFGEQAVLGASVRLATSMLADGIIDEVAPGVDLEVGQLDGGTSDVFDAVVHQFRVDNIAVADLEADVYRSVRGFLYSVSGDVVTDGVFGHGWDGDFPVGQDFMQQLVVPEALPAWLSEADVEFYGSELTRSGFHGGLSHLCAVVVHLRRKRSHRRQPARPGKVTDFVTGSTRRARTARRGSLDTTRASAAGQRRRRRIPNLAVIPPRHRRLGRAEPKKTLRTSHVTHRRDTDSRHNNA
jgi:Ketopantoate reductase PanE/ApbA